MPEKKETPTLPKIPPAEIRFEAMMRVATPLIQRWIKDGRPTRQ